MILLFLNSLGTWEVFDAGEGGAGNGGHHRNVSHAFFAPIQGFVAQLGELDEEFGEGYVGEIGEGDIYGRYGEEEIDLVVAAAAGQGR